MVVLVAIKLRQIVSTFLCAFSLFAIASCVPSTAFAQVGTQGAGDDPGCQGGTKITETHVDGGCAYETTYCRFPDGSTQFISTINHCGCANGAPRKEVTVARPTDQGTCEVTLLICEDQSQPAIVEHDSCASTNPASSERCVLTSSQISAGCSTFTIPKSEFSTATEENGAKICTSRRSYDQCFISCPGAPTSSGEKINDTVSKSCRTVLCRDGSCGNSGNICHFTAGDLGIDTVGQASNETLTPKEIIGFALVLAPDLVSYEFIPDANATCDNFGCINGTAKQSFAGCTTDDGISLPACALDPYSATRCGPNSGCPDTCPLDAVNTGSANHDKTCDCGPGRAFNSTLWRCEELCDLAAGMQLDPETGKCELICEPPQQASSDGKKCECLLGGSDCITCSRGTRKEVLPTGAIVCVDDNGFCPEGAVPLGFDQCKCIDSRMEMNTASTQCIPKCTSPMVRRPSSDECYCPDSNEWCKRCTQDGGTPTAGPDGSITCTTSSITFCNPNEFSNDGVCVDQCPSDKFVEGHECVSKCRSGETPDASGTCGECDTSVCDYGGYCDDTTGELVCYPPDDDDDDDGPGTIPGAGPPADECDEYDDDGSCLCGHYDDNDVCLDFCKEVGDDGNCADEDYAQAHQVPLNEEPPDGDTSTPTTSNDNVTTTTQQTTTATIEVTTTTSTAVINEEPPATRPQDAELPDDPTPAFVPIVPIDEDEPQPTQDTEPQADVPQTNTNDPVSSLPQLPELPDDPAPAERPTVPADEGDAPPAQGATPEADLPQTNNDDLSSPTHSLELSDETIPGFE